MNFKIITDDGTEHRVKMDSIEQFEEKIKYGNGNDFIEDVEGWRIIVTKILKYKPNGGYADEQS